MCVGANDNLWPSRFGDTWKQAHQEQIDHRRNFAPLVGAAFVESFDIDVVTREGQDSAAVAVLRRHGAACRQKHPRFPEQEFRYRVALHGFRARPIKHRAEHVDHDALTGVVMA